jgi:ABC-type transport system involved in multi-copper enzyme maturation permease subunit
LFTPGSTVDIPDWFFASVIFSPGDLNQMAVMEAFGLSQVMGITIEAPEWLNMSFLLVIQMIWIIIPLLLAYYFFKKRDI